LTSVHSVVAELKERPPMRLSTPAASTSPDGASVILASTAASPWTVGSPVT
jgi:hypothetical protein